MVCMFLGFCIFSLPTGDLCQIILKLVDFDNLVKRIKIESKKRKNEGKKGEGVWATLANTIHYATNQNFKLKLISNAEG